MVMETSVLGGVWIDSDKAGDEGQAPAGNVLSVLSPMDTVMLPFALDELWVFPPLASGAAYDFDRLKTSFAALVADEYPILGGSLQVDAKTGTVTVVQTHDEQEVAISSIPFEVVLESELTSDEATATQPASLGAMRDPKEKLISVKCTLLKDGGLAIGVNMSHTLMDGESVFTFMKVWGMHYRGVPKEKRPTICHQRELLQPKLTEEMMKQLEQANLANPTPTVPSEAKEEAKGEAVPAAMATFPKTTRQAFHITPEELKTLKASVTEGLTGEEYVSTIDVVTALMALLITQGRAHGKAVKLSTGVNARQKFEPPLPANYVGNVISGGFSEYTAEELAQTTVPALTVIARRIRESILRVNDAFLRGAIAYMASQKERASSLAFETNYFFGPDLMFTSWVKNGMYDADFGTKPWWAGPPQMPVCDGMIIIMEGIHAQPGLDVIVLLEDQAMQRLKGLWNECEFVSTQVA